MDEMLGAWLTPGPPIRSVVFDERASRVLALYEKVQEGRSPMEPVDVVCPFCESDIGEPCRNPQGGPLGNQGTRQKASKHFDRWDALAAYITKLEALSQGHLKASLRDEHLAIAGLQSLRPHQAAEVVHVEALLKSRRRRYGYIWQLLDREHKPLVEPYLKPAPKPDIPHPELIDCPRADCGSLKGQLCFSDDLSGLNRYHLLRIQRSPLCT
jgi:hypothetical protein